MVERCMVNVLKGEWWYPAIGLEMRRETREVQED
jgi:hypothetical protein